MRKKLTASVLAGLLAIAALAPSASAGGLVNPCHVHIDGVKVKC